MYGLPVRLRLTAWYAGIFFVCGALLLSVSYVLVRDSFAPDNLRIESSGAPSGESTSRGKAPLQTVPPDQLDRERRRNAEALRRVLTGFAAVLAATTMLSVVVGYVLAGRALRPMARISATARAINHERLRDRIRLAGPADEIKHLADTIDAMLDRLDDAFGSQRRFIGFASHELRTPLSVVRAELDELQETPLEPKQRRMADSAAAAVARSESLIAGLLTLARSEVSHDRHRSPVEFSTLVRDAVKRLPDPAPVAVSLDRDVIVMGEEQLLERLVDNLVENALRYNDERGHVSMQVTRHAEAAVLRVENTGPEIRVADAARLAEPFVRLDESRSQAPAGAGLGLAIVAAIVRSHDGHLGIAPRRGGGLVVTTRLPLLQH